MFLAHVTPISGTRNWMHATGGRAHPTPNPAIYLFIILFLCSCFDFDGRLCFALLLLRCGSRTTSRTTRSQPRSSSTRRTTFSLSCPSDHRCEIVRLHSFATFSFFFVCFIHTSPRCEIVRLHPFATFPFFLFFFIICRNFCAFARMPIETLFDDMVDGAAVRVV